MLTQALPLLLKLLVAHVLTDFIFQPTSWVDDKKQNKVKSIYLYAHIGVCLALTWLLLGNKQWWYVAVFIALTHGLIDIVKLYRDKLGSTAWFIGDQIAHSVILIAAWVWLAPDSHGILNLLVAKLSTARFSALALAYLLVLTPAGVFIRLFTERWLTQLNNTATSTPPIPATPPSSGNSLQEAGRYIGWLERLLVVTFVLLKQYEPIGLLIAAKSILRFQDTQHKESEYVVIGTLLSFSIAILIGLAAQWLLGQLGVA